MEVCTWSDGGRQGVGQHSHALLRGKGSQAPLSRISAPKWCTPNFPNFITQHTSALKPLKPHERCMLLNPMAHDTRDLGGGQIECESRRFSVPADSCTVLECACVARRLL